MQEVFCLVYDTAAVSYTHLSKAITEWVKEQKILSMKIYQNQWLIYDSYYKRNLENLTDAEREQKYSEWENYYQIQFPDGNGEVVLYGAYQSQLYNFATVLELLSSFTLFLILLFRGIRRKREDIRRLGKEIEILEGGNLDYEITVRGRDELAALAQGLDGMRRSLRDQIRQEAQLVKENKEIVTEMSHDLRTPLTSILLYTEILQKEGGQKGVEKRKGEEYLEKIAQDVDKRQVEGMALFLSRELPAVALYSKNMGWKQLRRRQPTYQWNMKKEENNG